MIPNDIELYGIWSITKFAIVIFLLYTKDN